ncbi:four helix bundle protein [Nonlabens sp.]|uniref:four helix bundle protein n=1 Tax=Nonlabens sp. TaxID=1888209 RepID=UPI00261AB7EE|nr:four helix bundle protein [Nonlabens sp.]
MALFSELPVYKLGYDLLIQTYQRTAVFSREYKYTLGERLKNETIDMLLNIYKANKSKKENREQFIDQARQNVEVIRLLLRLCKDLKIIGIKGFVALNMQVEELSKQLASWQKYTAGVRTKE